MSSVRLGTVTRYNNDIHGQSLVIELEDGRICCVGVELLKDRVKAGVLILTNKRLSKDNKLIERDKYWSDILSRLKMVRSDRYKSELLLRLMSVYRYKYEDDMRCVVTNYIECITLEVIGQLQHGLKVVTRGGTPKHISAYERVCQDEVWNTITSKGWRE